jgi:hypothetical protein
VNPKSYDYDGVARAVRQHRERTRTTPRRLPLTRGDCMDGPRPCPFVECRHHLDVEKTAGHGESPSCSLDEAEKGGQTLEEIGEIFGVTRERVRQVEAWALQRVLHRAKLRTVGRDDIALFAHPRGNHQPDGGQ